MGDRRGDTIEDGIIGEGNGDIGMKWNSLVKLKDGGGNIGQIQVRNIILLECGDSCNNTIIHSSSPVAPPASGPTAESTTTHSMPDCDGRNPECSCWSTAVDRRR